MRDICCLLQRLGWPEETSQATRAQRERVEVAEDQVAKLTGEHAAAAASQCRAIPLEHYSQDMSTPAIPHAANTSSIAVYRPSWS
jgi:hypothetical protein